MTVVSSNSIVPRRYPQFEIISKIEGISTGMAFMPIEPPAQGLFLHIPVLSTLSSPWTWKNLMGSMVTNCASGEATLFKRGIPCIPVG